MATERRNGPPVSGLEHTIRGAAGAWRAGATGAGGPPRGPIPAHWSAIGGTGLTDGETN